MATILQCWGSMSKFLVDGSARHKQTLAQMYQAKNLRNKSGKCANTYKHMQIVGLECSWPNCVSHSRSKLRFTYEIQHTRYCIHVSRGFSSCSDQSEAHQPKSRLEECVDSTVRKTQSNASRKRIRMEFLGHSHQSNWCKMIDFSSFCQKMTGSYGAIWQRLSSIHTSDPRCLNSR